MDRQKYLDELRKELRRLPREEYESAMAYYQEYFDEAGTEHEQQVIHDLGTPAEAASQIIREAARKRMSEPVHSVKKGVSTFRILVLAVFAVPIALPLAVALLMVLFAVGICVVFVWLCGFITSVACIGSGLTAAICGGLISGGQPATGLVNIGLGLLMIGFGLLALLLALWTGRFLIFIIRKIFSKILGGRKV